MNFKEYSKKLADNLQKGLGEINLKEIKEDKENKFSVIINTGKEDRDGESINVKGIDTTNYLKNPVVTADHMYNIQNLIGKVTKLTKKSNGEFWGEGYFAKSNPLAILAKDLYNEGILNTVSIGFITKQRSADFKEIQKCEMLEVSFTPVPADPGALRRDGKSLELFQKGVKAGLLIETLEKKELSDPYPECVMPLEADGTVSEEEKTCRRKRRKEGLKKELNISENILKYLKDINGEIAEIKSAVKSLSDDNEKKKSQGEELKKQEEKFLEKKEVCQTIDKALSMVLQNMKYLK